MCEPTSRIHKFDGCFMKRAQYEGNKIRKRLTRT